MPRYQGAWLALGWLMVLGVAAGSLASSLPEVGAGISDKLLHFTAYFGLAFLFTGAVERRHWPWVVAGLLALGAGIEAAQAQLVATRAGEWQDMAANAAGVLVGASLAARVPGGWCRRVELALGIGKAGR